NVEPYPPVPPVPAGEARNPVGIAALIAGIVVVVLGSVLQVVFLTLPAAMASSGASFSDIQQSLIPLQLVNAVVAVVALVLGLIGMLLPGRRRVAAAAGLAIGASSTLGILIPIIVGAAIS